MIVELKKKPNVRFIKETVKIPLKANGVDTYKDYVLIMLKNFDNGRSVVHPLSIFLLKWENAELNTMLKVANEIVPFLNYILVDNCDTYEIKELWDITFEHGADYLNELGYGRADSTVKSSERTLTQFYFFLAKKSLLKDINKSEFNFVTRKNSSGFESEVIDSPFEGVIYPQSGVSNRLHHFPRELVLPFLNTAIYKTPRIALGLYFQMFGGLRIGEVVNLTKNSITFKGPYGQNGMVLRLEKRELRLDLKNNDGKGGVKIPRYQTVIPCFGLLGKLYKYHIEKFNSKDTEALFVNNDGKALTERSYRNDFEKLKEEFILTLKKSDDLILKGYGTSLRQKKWNSHIGRGIFSNMVASVAENAVEIALARGDTSLDSALSYTSDAENLGRKVEENLNKMHIKMIQNSLVY